MEAGEAAEVAGLEPSIGLPLIEPGEWSRAEDEEAADEEQEGGKLRVETSRGGSAWRWLVE